MRECPPVGFGWTAPSHKGDQSFFCDTPVLPGFQPTQLPAGEPLVYRASTYFQLACNFRRGIEGRQGHKILYRDVRYTIQTASLYRPCEAVRAKNLSDSRPTHQHFT